MTLMSRTPPPPDLTTIFDTMQQAVIVTDAAGFITHWNPYAEKLYGWRAGEVLGRLVTDVTPSEGSRQRGVEIMKLLLSGQTWSGRYEVQRRDGSCFLAQATVWPLLASDGTILGVVGMSLPVETLSDADTRAREAEEMLATAFRTSRDALILFRFSDERIIDVNDTWLSVTGLTRDAAIGQKQGDLGLWGDGEEHERFRREISENGCVRDFRIAFTRSSGEQGVAILSADAVVVGGETNVLVTGRDVTDAANAEAEIIEAAGKYRNLFENTLDAVLLVTPESEVLAANPAAVAMFGWSEAELKQHGVDAIIRPGSADRLEAARTLDASGSYSGRQLLTRRDGSSLVGEVTISRFRDREGSIRSTVVIRDVTAATESLRALEAAEAKFRTLVEHALVGVYIIRNGRHVYVNPELTRILGYDEKTLLAIPNVLDLVVEDDRERVRSLMENRTDSLHYSFRVRRGDGAVVDVQVHGSVIEYEGEKAILGTAVDVTEQRRFSEALRRSENRYRTLVEEAQDIIFTCDLEGRITSLNRAFEEMTGWKIEEWIGRSYEEILEPDSLQGAVEHFNGILRDNLVAVRESRLKTSNRPSIIVEGTARPLVIDGQTVGTLGMVRDITQRRRLEVALERSGRFTALGRLAATLAHEFNNVLMGIQTSIDLFQRTSDPASLSAAVRAIGMSVGRGRRMTQEVLRFTKMRDPDFEIVEIPALIESIVPELESILGTNTRLLIDVRSAATLSVSADREQLQQVLTNLVINARDAMPSGGTVTLTVEARGGSEGDLGMAAIDVEDTGTGIPTDMLPFIFEPLFTTKKSGGTGLGLAIVSQIISRHRGTIEAKSEPGRGTCFEIRLPVVAHTEQAHMAEVSRSIRPIKKLLIVDDDETIATGLSAVLELEGVTAHTVFRGLEAEEAVERFSPEAVLLDLNLPDIDGREVYRRLMERWPSLAIIISSGHADEVMMKDLISSERSAFLLKPYDVETLLRTIADVRGTA